MKYFCLKCMAINPEGAYKCHNCGEDFGNYQTSVGNTSQLTEYGIRKFNLTNNPHFSNFKEGYWKSPMGTTIIKAIVSYEASCINISTGPTEPHSSVYPILWDVLFSEWTYLGDRV